MIIYSITCSIITYKYSTDICFLLLLFSCRTIELNIRAIERNKNNSDILFIKGLTEHSVFM